MDKKLQQDIKREFESNPSAFEEVFKLLSESVSGFIQKNKTKQDRMAYNAITGLLYFSTSKIKQMKDPIPFILPAIVYLFPNGYPYDGSVSDKKSVDAFCQKWIELEYKPNYFHSKGHADGKYLDNYIQRLVSEFKDRYALHNS